MLTLARKEGESIFITHGDEELEVIITSIEGSRMKISFEGPLSFEIKRDNIVNWNPQERV